MKINQKLLIKLIHYNPKTGELVRIAKLNKEHNIFPCKKFKPQSITPHGYYQLNILGRPYTLHRLIFLYMTGSFPKEDVDHIDGNRLNNKWNNLREVSRGKNLKNIGLRSTNKSGHIGVYCRKDTKKYSAYINHKGKKYSLGDFEKYEDAVKVRLKAEIEFGFHRNHGKRKAWTNKNSK